MSNIKTIFKNMGWMTIGQLVSSLLAFIWTFITARYLGVNEYGILGAALAFSGIFVTLTDVGTMFYAVREISADLSSEQKYMNACVTLRFILGAVYLAVVWLALIMIGWESYTLVICLLFAIQNFFNGFKNLLFISFQAHEQMKYQAWTYLVTSITTFIFILIVIYCDYGLMGVTLSYLLGSIISFIYCLYYLAKNFVVPKFTWNLPLFKILIIGGIPFALNGIFYNVYYSIDLVMLKHFSTDYAVGLYNASYKLIDILAIFHSVYAATVFPVMSKLFKDDTSLLKMSLTKSIKYLSLITIPLSVATILYGKDIILICYGAKFIDAGNVLSILIWTVVFLFINGASVTTLNASHQERYVTIMYFTTAVFNVVLNLILIPNYGIYGATIATLLSDILLTALALYMLNKINQLPGKIICVDLIKILISSVLMGLILNFTHLNLWIAIPIGIIVYLILCIILRVFNEDDKNIIKQVIGKA